MKIYLKNRFIGEGKTKPTWRRHFLYIQMCHSMYLFSCVSELKHLLKTVKHQKPVERRTFRIRLEFGEQPDLPERSDQSLCAGKFLNFLRASDCLVEGAGIPGIKPEGPIMILSLKSFFDRSIRSTSCWEGRGVLRRWSAILPSRPTWYPIPTPQRSLRGSICFPHRPPKVSRRLAVASNALCNASFYNF
ncbi:unnamed protein product [Nesidiocoris tenuis]|uniref:Uncharacterized protein n=1 Tax=Nesidiocoris tenuis TaxID=355587 RepID=A0A6H5HBI2_9HEMI|nr:unnamed protein product [Nesidiocoris tenuis]